MPTKEYLAKETPEQRERRLEYGRNYNKINSEKINKTNVEYQKRSEHYKKYIRMRFDCECGSNYAFESKNKHLYSIKHQNWIKQIVI